MSQAVPSSVEGPPREIFLAEDTTSPKTSAERCAYVLDSTELWDLLLALDATGIRDLWIVKIGQGSTHATATFGTSSPALGPVILSSLCMARSRTRTAGTT